MIKKTGPQSPTPIEDIVSVLLDDPKDWQWNWDLERLSHKSGRALRMDGSLANPPLETSRKDKRVVREALLKWFSLTMTGTS